MRVRVCVCAHTALSVQLRDLRLLGACVCVCVRVCVRERVCVCTRGALGVQLRDLRLFGARVCVRVCVCTRTLRWGVQPRGLRLLGACVVRMCSACVCARTCRYSHTDTHSPCTDPQLDASYPNAVHSHTDNTHTHTHTQALTHGQHTRARTHRPAAQRVLPERYPCARQSTRRQP